MKPVTIIEMQFEITEADGYERNIGNAVGDGTTSRGYHWASDFADGFIAAAASAGVTITSIRSLY